MSVPVPVLVRATVPLPAASTPEKVVEALLPPAVRVTAPTTLLVTVPAPASEATVSLKALRSTVAPVSTDRALDEPMPLAMPRRRVPALTVVAPL